MKRQVSEEAGITPPRPPNRRKGRTSGAYTSSKNVLSVNECAARDRLMKKIQSRQQTTHRDRSKRATQESEARKIIAEEKWAEVLLKVHKAGVSSSWYVMVFAGPTRVVSTAAC